MSRLPLRLTSILASIALLACAMSGPAAAASGHQYPTALRQAFIKACTKTAADVSAGKLTNQQAMLYCTRALTCIERKLSLKRFEATVRRMQSGQVNPDAKVLTKCEKSAAKGLKQ